MNKELLDKIGNLLIWFDLKSAATSNRLKEDGIGAMFQLQSDYHFTDAEVRKKLICEFLKEKDEHRDDCN